MAIAKLPVNFVDDIINTDISNKRRYNIIENSDGTISLEDVTTYRVIGSEFGAEQVNQTNETVNALIEKTSGIDDHNTIEKAKEAEKLSTPRKINDVEFDGTKDITIEDKTKLSLEKDFILINQQELNFVSGVTATLTDERIKADSLADVYFTAECYEIARKAYITVDTYDGRVILTAGREPEGTITATIHIRVV